MNIIHLDMDGVLADFDSHWFQLTHKRYEDYLTRDEFWSEVSKYPNIFQNLPLMHDAKYLVSSIQHMIRGTKFEIEVLTAIPRQKIFSEVAVHKEIWIKKHFSRKWKFKIGPHAVDKWKHAMPGDILIDDKMINIEQWNDAGGIGILHVSTIKTLHQLKPIIRKHKIQNR